VWLLTPAMYATDSLISIVARAGLILPATYAWLR
jgi:hypothetical protein